MLAGRLPNTEPYGWVGKHGDLKAYLQNTFSRLGGQGLDPANTKELIAYLERMPGPADMHTEWKEGAVVDNSELLAKGKELFNDAKTGCATCHGADKVLTDKTVHDVGSKVEADVQTAFDTPSLRYVSGSAPYFHDGRYATLEDLLNSPASEMGHTAQLGKHEREALKVYLESL
jgi:cytochrome c peroxidase